MSDLIAITFDGADDAEAALRSVRALEHGGKIGLEDTAVVTKDADGKVPRQERDVERYGDRGRRRRGAGRPAVRRLPGRRDRRRGVRRRADRPGGRPGIDGTFVKEVEDDLPAGGSALFLQLKDGDTGLLVAALRQYHGRVHQTSLDDEASRPSNSRR